MTDFLPGNTRKNILLLAEHYKEGRQDIRTSGLQDFRTSGLQDIRTSGLQKFVYRILEKQKIIVNLKLSDNTDRLTLAVLKTELKKKKERNKTAFEDAYRRKQNKKSQLAHSRKTNSSKTKPSPRAGVNDNNGEIQS